MAPRRKKRKTGLSRIDAALDAMDQYGFSRVLVRKVVRQLLKEYGGDVGWPFIEEYSYKELIDAILRYSEESNQAQITEFGSSSQVSSVSSCFFAPEVEFSQGSDLHTKESADGTLAGTSIVAAEENAVTVAEPTCDVAYPICSEDDNNFLTEGLTDGDASTKACGDNVSVPESAITISTSTPTTKLPRKPCYGWIESDEEYGDEDFLHLEPAVKSETRG